MPNLRLLLPYGIHERLSAYAVRDLQPDATIRIGILRRERCNSLIDGDADRVEVSSPFCQAPSLEVGGRILYARTRVCVRAREGWGLCITPESVVSPMPGFVFLLAICGSFFGFLLNSRSHPATGK